MVTRDRRSPGADISRREEHAMNKLVLTAAVGLAATALTGAAVTPAAGGGTQYTKHFISREIASHSLSARIIVGAAVDRHAGRIVGYESFTEHSYRTGANPILHSFAFRDGTISAVVHAGGGTVWGGEILNGTGAYKGVQGTLNVRPAQHNPNKAYIELTYHF
jgi:hypothetical protein